MNKLVTFFRESGPARFFISAGLILLIFGIIVFVINSKNQNYIKTEAIVSRTTLAQQAYTDDQGDYHEETYNVYVKYTVNGNEYDEELGELSGYKEGDKLKIYYNPENPTQITQTISMILPIVLIIGGLASLIGGIISAKGAIARYKKMKEQEKGWENNG